MFYAIEYSLIIGGKNLNNPQNYNYYYKATKLYRDSIKLVKKN